MPFRAEANSLKQSSYNIECIYSDGSLITNEYSAAATEEDKKFILNRQVYKVSGVDTAKVTSSTVLFINDFGKYSETLTDVKTCPKQAFSVQFSSNDDDSEGAGSILFYKFNSKIECDATACDLTNENFLEGVLATTGKNFLRSFIPGGLGVFGTIKDAIAEYKKYDNWKNALEAAGEQSSAILISERYTLLSKVDEPNGEIYYKLKASQASGNDEYVKFTIYDNVILVEKDGEITRLNETSKTGQDFADALRNVKFSVQSKKNKDGEEIYKYYEYPNINEVLGAYKTIYLNDPLPIANSDSSSAITYEFTSDIFDINLTYDKGNYEDKYTLSEEDPSGSDDKSGALCSKILKNTSPIISQIIRIIFIAVPALTIVLTALDIGKIVISGNLEEELPKKKKTIALRLIVVVIFIFLPTIVQVLLTMLKDTNAPFVDKIEYIDCLFNSKGTYSNTGSSEEDDNDTTGNTENDEQGSGQESGEHNLPNNNGSKPWDDEMNTKD